MTGPADHDRVLPADWAVPAVDATNRAWFTSGALALQQCAACGRVQHPPEDVCAVCGGMAFGEVVAAPCGRVHSYTVVHHAVHTALEPYVPYAVVLVALDEIAAVRVVGNLVGTAVEDVHIGLPVVAMWEERPADDGTVVRLPQWRRLT